MVPESQRALPRAPPQLWPEEGARAAVPPHSRRLLGSLSWSAGATVVVLTKGKPPSDKSAEESRKVGTQSVVPGHRSFGPAEGAAEAPSPPGTLPAGTAPASEGCAGGSHGDEVVQLLTLGTGAGPVQRPRSPTHCRHGCV